MKRLLLINPNTSGRTTAMMVELARADAPAGYAVEGATAAAGVPLIADEENLRIAGTEVVQSWLRAGPDWSGAIVGAFGDPGIDALRAVAGVPVVGLCEAAMLEASAYGRFAVVTITPRLEASMVSRAAHLGLAGAYVGARFTRGDPGAVAADTQGLESALAEAIADCIAEGGVDAVIIGGGPLGQAAANLAPRFPVPIVAPIPAAVRLLAHRIAARADLPAGQGRGQGQGRGRGRG